MDSGAFGSPVAATTVATNACGSVGERIVRTSRIRLFQDGHQSIQRGPKKQGTGMVDLLGPCGTIVGIGVVHGNIKSGMELHGVKLCPFEVAVQVVRVGYESVWTREILGERLG
jgi:hypothetical protein